jgi:hypothetical protein
MDIEKLISRIPQQQQFAQTSTSYRATDHLAASTTTCSHFLPEHETFLEGDFFRLAEAS